MLAELLVAALASWALAAWLDWSTPTTLLAWGGLVVLGLAITTWVAIRQLRASGTVHTGTMGYHVLSVSMALVFAAVGSGDSSGEPYLQEFYFVGRIMVEILILLFFLSFVLLAIATRQRLKVLHLLGPVVSLLSIAWLAYKFPG